MCRDKEPFYIITEYMCNGALLDYLRKEAESKAGRLTFDNLISISGQVSPGISSAEASTVVILNSL